MSGGTYVLATGNRHKLKEMLGLLPKVELLPLPDGIEMPPEDGDTFEANALIKARAVAAASGEPTIADDSGIEVAVLDGRPGIHSARYGGPDSTDESNLAKLLDEVGDAVDRRAAYVCVLALIEADGSEHCFEARCEGHLLHEPRGSGGFGYDPAFVPEDTGPDDERTMSELSQEEKDAISHRGRAARLLAAHLERVDGER